MTKTTPKPSPLLPLVKLCEKHRGLKSEVLRRIMVKGGKANWAQVSDWLHPEPDQRRVPRKVALKLMLEIQTETQKQFKT